MLVTAISYLVCDASMANQSSLVGWLVRRGRCADAEQSLRLLSSTNNSLDIQDTVALMVHTNNIEAKLMKSSPSYASLFRGADRRRTEIACIVWACQALCGAALTSYAPYFLVQAGFDPSHSFSLTIGMYGLSIIGGIIAWGPLSIVGRRKLYLSGLAAAVAILTACGCVAVLVRVEAGRNWIIGSLFILATFSYNLTVGPVCYVIVAEIPSTRLRLKTVALARVVYNLFTLLNNFIAPQMLNPTAWNLEGKATFVCAGTALICLLWSYMRLPETQKLSYIELDMLFESAAPTRRFKQLQDNLADTNYLSVRQAERMRNQWHGWLGFS